MECTVYYEEWQLMCCGSDFRVGEEISWLVEKWDDEDTEESAEAYETEGTDDTADAAARSEVSADVDAEAGTDAEIDADEDSDTDFEGMAMPVQYFYQAHSSDVDSLYMLTGTVTNIWGSYDRRKKTERQTTEYLEPLKEAYDADWSRKDADIRGFYVKMKNCTIRPARLEEIWYS